MTQKKVVISYIDYILRHLELYLPLGNIHMVDYFTKNVYEHFIPKNIQTEIKKVGFLNVLESIFENDTKHMPHLDEYIQSNLKLNLRNTEVCLSVKDLQNKLCKLGHTDFSSIKLEMFMKPKKQHEVEIMSCFVAALRNVTQASHVIDIGDGKGYLSSMLALNYKIPVLGIDAQEINTNGALDRAKKLSRVWNSVVPKIKSKETNIDQYKQITKFVDDQTNFEELVENIFLEKPTSLAIVGLHTCGNLAPVSIRIFNKIETVQMICNVGCCYHFLTENKADLTSEQPELGFPMSEYLKNKPFVLGRAARMIATQSVDRLLERKEVPGISIFYRSLFEVIIERQETYVPPENRLVGRFRKDCRDFLDYCEKASKRIKLDLDMTPEQINKIFEEYEDRINELNVFYLIRAMLGPVIESLILLDRLLFLIEQEKQESVLVQLFDPVVSPRCYGLISLKDPTSVQGKEQQSNVSLNY